MRKVPVFLFVVTHAAAQALTTDSIWNSGDERCPPPKDDGTYYAPYNALDSPHDYPTFSEAGKPGWSCSYQREDGVIVQYGDSRTPQQQWQFIWGGGKDDNN